MLRKANRVGIPVLMTASVSTRGMKGASFSDQEREQMYLDTLMFYECSILRDNNQKIVFADNSGWDLSYIKSQIGKEVETQVEFISLNPADFDISKGKGYNELLLINRTIEKSEFIKESGTFFKVTGRYPIYNLGYFLKKANKAIFRKGKDFYGDMKDHPIYDILRTGWCGHSGEARLYGSTVEWYMENLGSRYTELNDYEGRLVEGLLLDIMKNSCNISKRFKREPHLGGLEGSDIDAVIFTKNQDSLKGRMKRFIGNFIRICIPFLWF